MSLTGTRGVIIQNLAYVDQADRIQNQPPLTVGINTYCSISSSWLPRLWPSNCSRGTLAYLTPQVETFDRNRDPLSCILVPPCPDLTVYDQSRSQVFCLK